MRENKVQKTILQTDRQTYTREVRVNRENYITMRSTICSVRLMYLERLNREWLDKVKIYKAIILPVVSLWV